MFCVKFTFYHSDKTVLYFMSLKLLITLSHSMKGIKKKCFGTTYSLQIQGLMENVKQNHKYNSVARASAQTWSSVNLPC